MEKLLSVDHVYLTFQTRDGNAVPVLDDVTFHIEASEFVVLCGPSGCGKSSILRLIAGLLKPQKGHVHVQNEPVLGPGPERGIVFQSYNSFPWLTVCDNIEFAIKQLESNDEKRRKIVQKQIEVMGLQGFEKAYPAALSGGMRQRVALARTLAMNPLIVLLDEPFGALDPVTRYSMQNHLQESAKEHGWTVLFVTHDVDEAIFLADRVLILSHRPATVIAEEAIPFPRPRSFKIRDTRQYQNIRDGILRKIDSTATIFEESEKHPLDTDRHKLERKFTWSNVLRNYS